MTTALILDTETTGFDEPEVIELAYMGPLDSPLDDANVPPTCLRFKPSKPIALGAMATHHIIADDLTECDPWPADWKIPGGAEYLIGHNVDYDWRAIGSPEVKRICTLALARRLWPSLDSHSLSALIYHLYPHKLARSMVRGAHSAGADVALTYALLCNLWKAAGFPAWEKLWLISEDARVPTHFSWGKYSGSEIKEIRRTDPSYISWCLSGKCDLVNDDPYMRKALTR